MKSKISLATMDARTRPACSLASCHLLEPLSLSLSLHGFLASAFKTHHLRLLFILPAPFSSHFSSLGVLLLLAMKTSSPSSSATATAISILRALAFVAVFLSAISLSEALLPHEAVSSPLCDRHRHRLHHRRSYHRHAENSFSTWHLPPPWCLPFPRGRRQPPPPPPTEEEIDPRYGVKKRLVPTGPNPLHN